MKQALYNYDVFPLVFPVGKETAFTVKPLGKHVAFPENDCRIQVVRLDGGTASRAFNQWNSTEIPVKPDPDGCLRFSYTAGKECEHFFRVYGKDRQVLQASVYALDPDLAARRPLRGDLHMHTCRSDGREDPGTVCANYRKLGYDFAVITDHRRYYPSLEAIRNYAGARIPLNILPGEEVHIPQTGVHIVNAGGLFSVNGLFEDSSNYQETNGTDEGRRFDEAAPLLPIVSEEQYNRELDALEAELTDCPADVERRSFAVCCWAFSKIREAGGLGVFAHPYWISDVWQVPEAYTRYMLEKHPFDAFEVLGGENYYEQNGFQTAIYYDEYRAGRIHPIVGSTDTHGSTEHNRNADICSTIVFAEKNERSSLIEAIKGRYSVAVDSISAEYRLVGEFRLQKYASFLMENWYPIHDRLAAWDGELMRQYYVGDCTASELSAGSAKAEAQFEKYFVR